MFFTWVPLLYLSGAAPAPKAATLVMAASPETPEKTLWTRIRRISELIATDEGSQQLYEENPSLAVQYGSWEHFLDVVHKWRSRVPVLPAWGNSFANGTLDLEVKNFDDEQTVYLTIYHQNPPNTLTILKASWKGNLIIDLGFMRGIKNPFSQGQRPRSPWRY